MGFYKVEKKQFESYLQEYKGKLVKDVCGIFEPPILTYNDLSLGKYPESIIAKVILYDGSEYHGNKEKEYYIKK